MSDGEIREWISVNFNPERIELCDFLGECPCDVVGGISCKDCEKLIVEELLKYVK